MPGVNSAAKVAAYKQSLIFSLYGYKVYLVVVYLGIVRFRALARYQDGEADRVNHTGEELGIEVGAEIGKAVGVYSTVSTWA